MKLINYTEKSIALFGETYPIKDKLKELGKFNKFLTIEGKKTPGWIFSKKYEEEIKKLILEPVDKIEPLDKNQPIPQFKLKSKETKGEIKEDIAEYLSNLGIMLTEYGLAKAYIEEDYNKTDQNTKEDYIKMYAVGLSIDSFYRFGDRNLYRPCMNYVYFAKNGTSIDSAAVNVSEYFECTPQDIVDFIVQYPNGYNMGRSELQTKINEAFQQYFDKQINISSAKGIVKNYMDALEKLRENNLIETKNYTNDENAPF